MSVIKRQLATKNAQKDNKTATKKQRTLDVNINGKDTGLQSPQDEPMEFLFDDDMDIDFSMMNDAFKQTTEAITPKLDLSSWKRCIVEHVKREACSFDLVIQVHVENSASAHCHLQGQWSHTKIDAGDIVSLRGVWDAQLNAYKVNSEEGFCVTNPDYLISGTSVVGSLFCRRKTVLQDRFRGMGSSNSIMVVGTLAHEVLQTVLSKGLKTHSQIDAVVKELIQCRETVDMLFGSCIALSDIESDLQSFVPNIMTFVEQYVEGQEPAVLQKDTFQGCITEICDIEENLWVPQLGLKGKVDASVRIKRRSKNALKFTPAANEPIIPLELKTGRASFSMEHTGQLILYQVMLSALGDRGTTSGLLLYLRNGLMREIRGKRNEERDLIMLRNDLCYYLTRPPKIPTCNAAPNLGDEKSKIIQPFELPEPISHRSACASCEYSTICCAFAQTDSKLQLSEVHPLRTVMSDVLDHLHPLDYEYFMHWCGLVALEEQEEKKGHHLRALWTLVPEERQRQRRAIFGLLLNEPVLFEKPHYVHKFELDMKENELDLTLSGFFIGEYVIVSTGKRLAIAAGWVQALSVTIIVLKLERNLLQNYANKSFIVDKHDSQSGNVFNFTNLGLLLEKNEHADALRAIVIQRQQPVFQKTLPTVVSTKGSEILHQLNAEQRSAVLKALTTDSFMLIKGLPGTGKTLTLVAIVRLLNLMNKSVLITSHTHSAVDNLLLRLKPFVLPMLRLGSAARVHAQLSDFNESEVMKDCQTESQLINKYKAYDIVGVTCLGSAHSVFLYRQFDVCIVDEATQVMQPTVLRPLLFSKKFILVGDPDQLPPLVRSREARTRGADESLFYRLDSPQATSILVLQYRMNKTITRLANELTYAGKLQCASETVKTAVLKLKLVGVEKWLQRALQPHIDQAVFLLNTQSCAERSFAFASMRHSRTLAAIEQSFAEVPEPEPTNDITALSPTKCSKRRISKYTNYCEAAIIFHIVKELLKVGYDPERIGIIAPYRAQVELLRTLAAQYHNYFQLQNQTAQLNFQMVEVNTVDQFQGRDKDIILYSCTRTGASDIRDSERTIDAEILEDKRRLTVAITRSKLKLILIGDDACLQQYSPFRTLFKHIPKLCQLSLVDDDKLGFQWQILLNELSRIINN